MMKKELTLSLFGIALAGMTMAGLESAQAGMFSSSFKMVSCTKKGGGSGYLDSGKYCCTDVDGKGKGTKCALPAKS